MDYTNCFAYRDKTCTALSKKLCVKGNCPFYKPLSKQTNYIKIETDIINYSSIKNVYRTRNNQIYS